MLGVSKKYIPGINQQHFICCSPRNKSKPAAAIPGLSPSTPQWADKMNLVCFSNLNYSVILSGIASHGDEDGEEADKGDIADISAELTSRLATWQVGIMWSSSLL